MKKIKQMVADIEKFSWAQMVSNTTGKTSSSGFCGVIIILVGSLSFLVGVADFMCLSKKPDIMNDSLILIPIGATLLGARKLMDSKSVPLEIVDTKDEILPAVEKIVEDVKKEAPAENKEANKDEPEI